MKYTTFLLEIATAFVGALIALYVWQAHQSRKGTGYIGIG